jgi:general secretion pathway protein G
VNSPCARLTRADTGGVNTKRDTQAKRRRERGYSLLEVLIVLTIIALIAALVGPRLMMQLDRSKQTAARVQVRSISAAIETMRLDLGRYPTNEEGIALLNAPPQNDDADLWRGPYLDGETPVDPWGAAYVYEAPQADFERPRVISLGSDGEVGGEGLAEDIAYGDTP